LRSQLSAFAEGVLRSGKLKTGWQHTAVGRCRRTIASLALEVRVGSEPQGRYVISQLLGGGFGIVWRATDKLEGRDVAIKRMKNFGGGGELDALLSEARQINALRGHKNIV